MFLSVAEVGLIHSRPSYRRYATLSHQSLHLIFTIVGHCGSILNLTTLILKGCSETFLFEKVTLKIVDSCASDDIIDDISCFKGSKH